MLDVLLPKGRIFAGVETLLADCGLHLSRPDRVYRPTVSDDRFSAKIMKAQNIPALIELGSHDVGITGYDWVKETGADIVELIDFGFDPVQIVAAAPEGESIQALLAKPGLRVATEYEALTRQWLDSRGVDYHLIRSWGATEVFAPEDADIIVDNTATGTTLRQNGLEIVDVLLRSTTRMYANRAALNNPEKREVIDELLLLITAVLEARKRVLLEMNIDASRLDKLIERLPAMKSPTVARLYNSDDYAVKVAVLRADVARLVPELKRLGATDILEMDIRKVVP